MSEKPLILICDDDAEILQVLHLSLRSCFEIMTANSVEKAKKLAENHDFDAAIIDLNFEGQELDGIHLIDYLNKKTPGTFLIVLSGDTSVKRAIEATRRKLFKFIVKDGDYFEDLLKNLKNATDLRLSKRNDSQKNYKTKSVAVKELLIKLERIIKSNSESPILILGESGTGKEYLAKHIGHQLNLNSVTANMGCIPKETAESILFGHERGAFTGAISNKAGLIETAHNGLFFLDEIGECSSAVQAKLLRVIQEKEVQSLGSNKTKKIKVRFIAATHANLNDKVNDGSFRLDLLQRLNTFVLKLPALRERREDILYYARHFIDELSYDGATFTLVDSGEKELLSYSWPGNIRELRNVIERIIVLSPKYTIDGDVVREAIEQGLSPTRLDEKISSPKKQGNRLDEIIFALNEFNGNKRFAAMKLGISEATLYRWIKEFNLNKVLGEYTLKTKAEAYS